MVGLPKNFFDNLSSTQYKEYLKLLPKINNDKTRRYIMLSFTLAALSIFGIFAIKPTLSTIADLKRQTADLEFVYQKLSTKAQSLSRLKYAYGSLEGDLPLVFEAVPQSPQAPKSLAQINALLAHSNLKTTLLQISGVEITTERLLAQKDAKAFDFSLEAEGSYEDINSFIWALTRIDRIITIETVSIMKDEKKNVLILNLKGREYFKS